MASPHVAGAATLYLQKHPAATPAQVATALTDSATRGVMLDAGIGSPNRLLFTLHFGDTTPPTISAIEPASGATVSGIQALRVSAEDDTEMASVTASACRSRVGTAGVAPYSIQWNTTTQADPSRFGVSRSRSLLPRRPDTALGGLMCATHPLEDCAVERHGVSPIRIASLASSEMGP